MTGIVPSSCPPGSQGRPMMTDQTSRPIPAQAGRRRALVALVVWVFLCAALVVALTDTPRGITEAGRGDRAAIALRDHVIPFYKHGTKLFTLPALERSYGEVRYLTQRHRGDRRQEFLAALDDLLARHEQVDIFLLVHGRGPYVHWLRQLDRDRLARLRLVYSTGCGDTAQADDWLALGADAYVSHPGRLSISPIFYVYFLRRWLQGLPLDQAVAEANERTAPRLAPIAQLIAMEHLVDHTRAGRFGDGTLQIDAGGAGEGGP